MKLRNALFAIFLFVSVSYSQVEQGAANSAPSKLWFSPKFKPAMYGITAFEGKLWLFGAEETIASSDNDGKSWRVVHSVTSGAVLLNGTILNSKTVFATGTRGLIEFTRDAGDTWQSVSVGPKAILLSAFADELNGIVVTTDGAFVSTDGWKSWRPVKELFEDDAAELKYVFAVAALPNRYVLMLKQGAAAYYGNTGLLVSDDAGKSWQFVEVPHTVIHSLISFEGKFWIVGNEVIDRDKVDSRGYKGGHSVPMVMTSPDGKTWSGQDRPAAQLSSCTAAGCLAFDGSSVDPFAQPYVTRVFSPTPFVTLKWAAVGKTVCLLSGRVSCTEWTDASQLPTQHKNLPVAVSPVSFDNHSDSPPLCVSCPMEHIFVDASYGGQAAVTIRFAVRADGTTDDIQVLNAPSAKIQQTISDSIKNWILDPVIQDGKPVTSRKQVQTMISVVKND